MRVQERVMEEFGKELSRLFDIASFPPTKQAEAS